MNEEQQSLSPVTDPGKRNIRAPKASGFHRGHLKAPNSGRKKHSSQYVRQLSEELGICPIEFMLRIVKDGYVVKTVLKDGKRTKVEVDASLDQQLDCAKTLAQYLVPKLQSTALTNADHDGPAEVATVNLDVTKLTAEQVAAAQTLALALCSQDDAPTAIEATAESVDATPMDIEQAHATDSTGHWRSR